MCWCNVTLAKFVKLKTVLWCLFCSTVWGHKRTENQDIVVFERFCVCLCCRYNFSLKTCRPCMLPWFLFFVSPQMCWCCITLKKRLRHHVTLVSIEKRLVCVCVKWSLHTFSYCIWASFGSIKLSSLLHAFIDLTCAYFLCVLCWCYKKFDLSMRAASGTKNWL